MMAIKRRRKSKERVGFCLIRREAKLIILGGEEIKEIDKGKLAKLSKKKREKGKQRGSSREAKVTKEGAAILSGVGNLVIKKERSAER